MTNTSDDGFFGGYLPDTPPVFESNTNVQGLAKLLLSVASRLENGAEGVSKELLEQAARRIILLEGVATVATHVVSIVPHKRDSQHSSKVPRDTLLRLCDALNMLPEFRVRRIR